MIEIITEQTTFGATIVPDEEILGSAEAWFAAARLPKVTVTPAPEKNQALLQYQRDLDRAIEFRTQVWAQGGEWNWTEEELGLVAPEGVDAQQPGSLGHRRLPIYGVRHRTMIFETLTETGMPSMTTQGWHFDSPEHAQRIATERIEAWPYSQDNPYVAEDLQASGERTDPGA